MAGSTNSGDEQIRKGKNVQEQKQELQQDCQCFQMWLTETKKLMEEQSLRFVKDFSAGDIEARLNILQAEKQDVYCRQQSELKRISLFFQHMITSQPGQVAYIGSDLRYARKSFGALVVDMAGQIELMETMLPLATDWEESRDVVTEFLSRVSDRSHLFLKFDKNDIHAIEYEDEAKRMLSEFEEKLPIRHVYVTSTESIVDLAPPEADWFSLEDESTSLRRLWDDLVTLLKQFLLRVTALKEDRNDCKRKEADRIDKQLRREAKQCCCSKPFKIVRLSEGKYTFGDSRIARLVRIHGSSVVVRVGGGWQFLMEFLTRNDPCRANLLADANLDAVDALGLIPTGNASNSFSLEINRSHRLSVGEKSRVHCRRSFSSCTHRDSVGELSFSGSRDSIESSLSGGQDDQASDVSSPRQGNVSVTKQRRSDRPSSDISSASTSDSGIRLDTSVSPKSSRPSSKTPTRRVSLVDRQNEYASKRRSLSANRKTTNVK